MNARLAQLLYRLMRDHDIPPDEMLRHIQECRKPGEVYYSRVSLGRTAQRLARTLTE